MLLIISICTCDNGYKTLKRVFAFVFGIACMSENVNYSADLSAMINSKKHDNNLILNAAHMTSYQMHINDTC